MTPQQQAQNDLVAAVKAWTANPWGEDRVLRAARAFVDSLEKGEAEKCALSGEWRHSKGMLFCGTLRIAKTDFDTSPSPSFADRILSDICRTMNAALAAPAKATEEI